MHVLGPPPLPAPGCVRLACTQGIALAPHRPHAPQVHGAVGLRTLLSVQHSVQLTPESSASLIASWQPHVGPGLQFVSQRQLSSTFTGEYSWVVGPPEAAGMSLGITRRTDKTMLSGRLEVRLGAGRGGSGARRVWQAFAGVFVPRAPAACWPTSSAVPFSNRQPLPPCPLACPAGGCCHGPGVPRGAAPGGGRHRAAGPKADDRRHRAGCRRHTALLRSRHRRRGGQRGLAGGAGWGAGASGAAAQGCPAMFGQGRQAAKGRRGACMPAAACTCARPGPCVAPVPARLARRTHPRFPLFPLFSCVLQGITLKLRYNRAGHLFEFPVLLSSNPFDWPTLAAAYLLPPLAYAIGGKLVVGPLRRGVEARRWARGGRRRGWPSVLTWEQ